MRLLFLSFISILKKVIVNFVQKIAHLGNSKVESYRFNHAGKYKLRKNIIVQDGIQKDSEDSRDLIKQSPTPLSTVSGNNFNIEIVETSLKYYAPDCYKHNQKDVNACGGFAGAAAVYILLNRMQKMSVSSNTEISIPYLSPLWIYWYARINDGFNSTLKDEGTTIRSVMKALKSPGVIDENIWRFDKHTPFQEPDNKALSANTFKIHNYFRVPINADAPKLIKDIIAFENLPIVGGLMLYEEQMAEAENTGILRPVIKPNKAKLIGGHAIRITRFKVINDVTYAQYIKSWGEDWGDNGYGYFPLKWASNPYYMIDLWTFDKQYF